MAKGSSDLEAQLEDSLHEIHPNLKVLPSGGKTRAATEMLERTEFDLVMDKLRQMAEVIIVDSPPIGLFPDSLAIARKVKKCCLLLDMVKFQEKSRKSFGEHTGNWCKCSWCRSLDLPQKKTPVITIQATMGMVTLDINTIINIMVKILMRRI